MVLIVLALVYYLVSVIVALRKITAGLDETIAGVGEIVQKSAPVNDVVTAINEQLDAGVDALEGLLVKKAGMTDAVGLVDGLYAGAGAAGFRNFPESATTKAPRIGEVYTKGTLTLARLGREAPIAAASPAGSRAQKRRPAEASPRGSCIRRSVRAGPTHCPGHRSSAPRPRCSTSRASSAAGPRNGCPTTADEGR